MFTSLLFQKKKKEERTELLKIEKKIVPLRNTLDYP